MGRKLGAVPLLGGAGSPPNTMWPSRGLYLRTNFHLDPSNRLATIHQRHRQTGQDNGPIAQGEPFYTRNDRPKMASCAKTGGPFLTVYTSI